MVDKTGTEVFDRRPYNDYPYLVIPVDVYRVSFGMENISIRAFVYERDDLFGDPLPLNLAGLDIFFYIYDEGGLLVNVGKAYVSDLDTSEVEYIIQNLDIKEVGKYYGQFMFIDLDGSKLIMPDSKQKQKILISVM